MDLGETGTVLGDLISSVTDMMVLLKAMLDFLDDE